MMTLGFMQAARNRERKSKFMSDENKDFYCIIAEYRNVALLEKRGDKRSVWQGKEYFTDGHVYVPWTNGIDRGAYVLDSELEAKTFIDGFSDNNNTDKTLLGYKVVHELLSGKPFVGPTPNYIFDKKSGVFVFIRDVAGDGQHQHGGLNVG